MTQPDMAIRTAEDAKKQEELQRLVQMQIKSDVKSILATPEGIRFFRFLINKGHVFKTTFTGNAGTYFNEGARNLVNEVLTYVTNQDMLRLIKRDEEGDD